MYANALICMVTQELVIYLVVGQQKSSKVYVHRKGKPGVVFLNFLL